MGEIAKINSLALQNANISPMTRDVYNANQNISIVKIEDKNMVVKSIHTFVNQTIMDKGVGLEPEEINYIKTRVVDDIMKEFSNLSLDDIRLAMYYGVRGEFGEYFGINPISFYGWLKHYKSEILPKVYQQVSPLLLKDKPESPVIDQKQIDRELANTIELVYWNLCLDGTYNFNDIGNIHYKFLHRIGLINISEEEDNRLFEQAKNNVMLNLSNRNNEKSKQGKVYHKINLNDALEQIERGDNNSFTHEVQIEKMKLILYHVLKNYAESDVELDVLLKEKLV